MKAPTVRRNGAITAAVDSAVATLDAHPAEVAVVLIPEDRADRANAIYAALSDRPGEFAVRRLGVRRYAIAKREAVKP